MLVSYDCNNCIYPIDFEYEWLYLDNISSSRTRSQGRAPAPVRRRPQDLLERATASGCKPTAVLETTMSKSKDEVVVSVSIIPNQQGSPAGKLADAEVMFEAASGPLSGMKLIGFAVWERRDGGRNVTFPARRYSVNGERRSFALLRPANGDASAQEAIRQCILEAYQRSEAHA